MALTEFVRVPSDDDTLSQVQDRIEQSVNDLLRKTELDTQRVTAQAIATSPGTAVQHKLGRQPVGWYLTDISAAATIHRTAWDSRTITLVASSAATVDLVVF